MKVVIDILEKEYELIRHGNKSPLTELELMRAVANGTPLPEHHERPIDADKKPGKWELRSVEGPGRALIVYKCSECKKFALYMTDYCPSCGAKMEWRRQNEERRC